MLLQEIAKGFVGELLEILHAVARQKGEGSQHVRFERDELALCACGRLSFFGGRRLAGHGLAHRITRPEAAHSGDSHALIVSVALSRLQRRRTRKPPAQTASRSGIISLLPRVSASGVCLRFCRYVPESQSWLAGYSSVAQEELLRPCPPGQAPQAPRRGWVPWVKPRACGPHIRFWGIRPPVNGCLL
jgi:hypothetical protein